MADFKTHISVGAATAFGLSVFSYLVDWVSNIYIAVIIFFATLIGSFLPDMDSNSGLPVKIIFGFYAYLSATLALYFAEDAGVSIYMLIILPAAAFVFVKVILENIFSKYTMHRGVFHSIPAGLISFLLTFFIAGRTTIPVMEQFIISLSIGLGYFCHLLLDELFAMNFLTSITGAEKTKKEKFSFRNIYKRHFGVKTSFGTALDFGFNQKEKFPAVIAYLILIILIFLTYTDLKNIWLMIK